LLNSAGFEVISATDLINNQMIQAIQEFSGQDCRPRPEHWWRWCIMLATRAACGENYLVPGDAKISSEPDLINVQSASSMDGDAGAIPSRMRIVILDACRNNPFPRSAKPPRTCDRRCAERPRSWVIRPHRVPKRSMAPANQQPIYFCIPARGAREEPADEALFKRIRLDVNNTTNGQQTPWESSSLTSDFYFFGDTAVAATTTARAGANRRLCRRQSAVARRAPGLYDYVLAENSIDNYQGIHPALSSRSAL